MARLDVQAAAEQIIRLAYGLDLIKVISSVRVAMTMQEANHGENPPAAILELIALVLTHRDATTARDPVETSVETSSRFMPPDLAKVTRGALYAGSMISLFEATPGDPQSRIRFYSVQREIMLRNPVYPFMLLDTLRGLFGNDAVNDDCRSVLGFSGEEAVTVMEELRKQSGTGLQGRFDRMLDARDATLPFLTSRRGRSGPSASGPQPSEADRAVMMEMLDALRELSDAGDAAIIDTGVIAERTGYPVATVDAVLDAYTLTGLNDLDETLDRFFRGDNPLRTAPIVIDEHGRRMLVHDALALPAVREVIEVRLKAAGRQKAYEAHRGTWVENAAVELLARVFADAQVFRGFKYFIPDPYASVEQTTPEKFTKLVEGDGLILIDDVAIIIEVKSVALTAEARSGVGRTLQGKLRDIITHAASQAVRLRERILTDQRIRLKGNEWIDADNIREIHTIAVGLEDLSGVTTATTALLAAGVLAPDHIPWTVSVHDLRIVCELLERPAELLLYLRRRTEPTATWRYRAVDELDLFLHFLVVLCHDLRRCLVFRCGKRVWQLGQVPMRRTSRAWMRRSTA
jgi:hypothetical protein